MYLGVGVAGNTNRNFKKSLQVVNRTLFKDTLGIDMERHENILPTMLMQLLHQAGCWREETANHGRGQFCQPTWQCGKAHTKAFYPLTKNGLGQLAPMDTTVINGHLFTFDLFVPLFFLEGWHSAIVINRLKKAKTSQYFAQILILCLQFVDV